MCEEKELLLGILAKHKNALAWKVNDIKGTIGGHYGADITARKVFESRFYWPTIFKDSATYVRECDACKKAGNISSRNQIPLTNILVIETSGQIENTNRAIKRIVEMTINENKKEWTDKLDDSLWAFRTAYKAPIGSTPFRIIYGKACHQPLEMEHKAYWALKEVDLDLDAAGKHKFLQLNQLDELRTKAYEHSRAYKERNKWWHDSKIMDKEFQEGEEVLVFNSRLNLSLGKLITRWYRPYTVSKVYSYGIVKVRGKDKIRFKVNVNRSKLMTVPIIIAPNWDLNFELMCDASDHAEQSEGIMTQILPQGKFLNQDSIGQPFLRILPRMFENVMPVKRQEISLPETKFPLPIFSSSRLATPYHPQTSGQIENTNRAIKRIVEMTVNENKKEWTDKLDDSLWAFRTAYKAPIGSTPFRIVYGKACHQPLEMEHKAYWALKEVDLDLDVAGKHKFLQLNQLDELRTKAYEHSRAYKERNKRWHDSKIMDKEFQEGEEVLVFNSRLNLSLGN
nr:retrovirus-related Pol polyprotein from transposon 412 family [Tanacetum cinerariifolium]